jgi:uncharacterized protein
LLKHGLKDRYYEAIAETGDRLVGRARWRSVTVWMSITIRFVNRQKAGPHHRNVGPWRCVQGPLVPRFLCDEMLNGLGRWLRAAGYDTVIAVGGLSDRAIAARCAEEHRVLLTKDRRLATTIRGDAPVVLLPGGGIDEAARGLRGALGINWQHAPFTRCIVDNRLLEAAPPHSATQVPERSRAAGGPLRVCPECGRLYWPGGHARRMQQRLAAWQSEPGASNLTELAGCDR